MPKKCKRCGTANDSDARFCKACRDPFSSKAGHGTVKPVLCKKCNTPRRVTGGPFVDWFTPDGPIDQYWEEREFCVLECKHKYFTRKTGRTKPWEP